MKRKIKILLMTFSFLIFLFGCQTTNKFSIDNYMDTIIEVASQITYYDHLKPVNTNLYTSPQEFQGQCIDYALLFSLKTGAYMILVNQGVVPNGIYKIVGKDGSFEGVQFYRWTRTDNNGKTQSFVYRLNDRSRSKFGMYHPEIGAYIISKVENFTARDSNMHAWNVIGDTEIDVNLFDTTGIWAASGSPLPGSAPLLLNKE